MGDGSMTIAEVKDAKMELQNEILRMVKRFESETGTRLGYINVERNSDNYYDEAPVEEKRGKTIKSVEVSMDIDVI